MKRLNPEQEERIDQRIDEAFEFMRDMLNDPGALEVIPNDATLTFRHVVVEGVTFHLAAYQDPEDESLWIARVTGPAAWAIEGRHPQPPLLEQHRGKGGKWGSPPTHPEHGRTAEEALASLAEKLRDATGQFEVDRPGSSRNGFRIA